MYASMHTLEFDQETYYQYEKSVNEYQVQKLVKYIKNQERKKKIKNICLVKK